MANSLKGKALHGTLWGAVERFSVQGVQFVVMIVMAKLLTPADYGLVGMLTVFITVSQSLVDSGFSQALIRKRDRTEIDNNTVFYFNIVVGLILYLVLYSCAPLIADFYNEPTLVPLTRVICFSVFINSFVVVQRALFSIKIDFKSQAKASLLAAVLSGVVGIFLAYDGAGVWAIVWQTLASFGLNAIFLWWMSSWRPKLMYSWVSFRELFGFGSKLALSGLLETIYNNLYQIVIGKVYSAGDLGAYTRAKHFAEFPSLNIMAILHRVTYPVLCTINDDDARLALTYRRLLRFSTFVIFPIMTCLAAIASPMVTIILNPQWAFAAVLLSILCFQMMWYPVHVINLNLLQVKGRSDLFLKLEVWKKIVSIVILVITIPMGLIAMCVGSVFASIIALVINTHYTGKLIKVGFLSQMRDILPTLLNSLFCGGIAWIITIYIPNPYASLPLALLCAVVIYFVVAKLYKAEEIKELNNLIKRK